MCIYASSHLEHLLPEPSPHRSWVLYDLSVEGNIPLGHIVDEYIILVLRLILCKLSVYFFLAI